MHEIDMSSQLEVLTNGGFNSVFKMTDLDGSTHIVKILESDKDFSDRNFDRVRRDSLVMERASDSDYVVDIYSFCGFSQIVEYGRQGNLDQFLDERYDDLSQSQKLHIATQVAQALADVHDLDGTGISSMSHGDFASKQYILIDGHFKLNDFNRGRLIRWNSKLQRPCSYTIGPNDGTVSQDIMRFEFCTPESKRNSQLFFSLNSPSSDHLKSTITLRSLQQ